MSKAEDLIAASFEEQKLISRSVVNDELTIDGETREINVPESEMLFGVEGDVDIERKYFRCPKIVGDNIDLSKHLIYVAYVYTENQNNSFLPEIGIQSYLCTDVQAEGDDITFSWKLSGNVFKNPGFIAFKVFAKEKEESPLTVFNTVPAFGIVKMTIPDGNKEIAEKYPDVISQIFDRLDALESGGGGGTGGTTNYNNLSNKPQLNGVTLEGNKTLDQVGVLAKNQGASNSGKYLSVGSDGNVALVDAPSGGSLDPEQVNQAVEDYLTENPVSGMTTEQEQQLNQNTTDVADLKSAINQKGLPEGGTTGQILKKKSDADYDAGWEDEKTGLLAQNQINSLYDLIKICAYTEIPTEKIKAFETAWGIESTDPEPPDGTKYTINRTLTNCTSSSSLLEIIEGQTLSEKITANSGFELSKVTVIMGGLDITSTVYSEGGINIASVSGDIEITAIAEEEASDVLFNMTMNRFISVSKTPIVYSDEGQTQIEVPSNAVWYDSIEKIKSDGYVSIKFISESDIYSSVYMAVREQGIDVKQVESFYYATEFTTNQLAGTNHLTKNIEYEIKANVKGDYMVCLIIGAPYEIASINAKLKSGGEL